MDDETLVLWQDVLDEIAAGRDDHLACPHCTTKPLRVDRVGGLTKVSCAKCGRFIEGRFGN